MQMIMQNGRVYVDIEDAAAFILSVTVNHPSRTTHEASSAEIGRWATIVQTGQAIVNGFSAGKRHYLQRR